MNNSIWFDSTCIRSGSTGCCAFSTSIPLNGSGILGDMCYRSEYSPAWYLKQLKGKKHLIQGNHDGVLLKDSEAMGCMDSVDKMLFVQDSGERIVLCHFPIAEWNGFHKGAYHIYGHIHNRKDGVYQYMRTLERALNAGCMLNGYEPVTFRELIENNKLYKK